MPGTMQVTPAAVPAVDILRLAAPKANAIDLAFLDALERMVDQFEAGPAQAGVLTGTGRFFSVGLALPALHGLPRAEMRAFITRFGEVTERLFNCPKPVVAAVNGHAIAGGCVLALQADTRLMAEGETNIGLNEAQLGIGLPSVVLEPLRLALPPASLLPVGCEGRLFRPAEARVMGLVDAVVPAADLEARALARAAELAAVPSAAFAQIKLGVRRTAREAIRARAADETERWLDTWYTAEAQRRLGDAVAKLRR